MGTSTHKLIILKELAGNTSVRLDPVQQFLAPHIQVITIFWIAIWCGTVAFVLTKLVREYLAHRKASSR